MFRESHRSNAIVHAIAAQSLGATGAGGKVSKIIDTAGYGTIEFVNNYGSVTATSATVVVSLKDGDVTGTLATVSAANLVGTVAAAGVPQAAVRASGVSKNFAAGIGYIGLKRYVQITLAPTASGAIIASSTAILGAPRTAPVPAGS